MLLLLLLTMLHLRLAQYHAQYGIWSTLKECTQCLPDVLVGRVEILSRWYARCRCAALLIQAKSIQKAFILERLFLVDCNDDDDSRNNVLTTVLIALIAIVAMPCIAHSPCVSTPSSSSACHMPAAWARVCTMGAKFTSQSTSSVPGAHLRINLPDTCGDTMRGRVSSWLQLESQLAVPSLTLRSFKQLELSTTNNVRSAQPMRFIAGLGDYPSGSNVSNKRRRYITYRNSVDGFLPMKLRTTCCSNYFACMKFAWAKFS